MKSKNLKEKIVNKVEEDIDEELGESEVVLKENLDEVNRNRKYTALIIGMGVFSIGAGLLSSDIFFLIVGFLAATVGVLGRRYIKRKREKILEKLDRT